MPKNLKTEEIVDAIVKMRLEKNASNKTIMDFLKNELGYKQAYSYELLQSARKKIQEVYTRNIEEHFEEAKGQLEEMLEKATKRGDSRLMLQIRQELNKLLGLYSAEKIDITSGGDKITEIRLIQVNKKDE
jgi:activator of 2-hydroxyglutaryl-CoA dehydratase